jgi:hypothetical protein
MRKNTSVFKNYFLNLEIFFQKWTDEHLHWKPSLHGDIESIILPSYLIWKPDILLYQSIKPGFDTKWATENSSFEHVELRHTGECIWLPPDIVMKWIKKLFCDIMEIISL